MDWKIFGRAFGGAALKFATFAALAVTVSVLSHFWPVVTGIGLGLVLLAGMVYMEYSNRVWDQQRAARAARFDEEFGKK